MANYHLVKELEKQNYKEISFNEIKGFEHLELKKLEDITNFTSCFRDINHLNNILLRYNLIKEEEYSKKIVVIYKAKNETKKLMYGLTFYEDRKFFDISYIKNYLKSKINDLDFLNKFCNHYRNTYNQKTNIDIITNYVNYKRFYPDEVVENDLINDIQITMDFFVNNEVYTYDKVNNRSKLMYKRLRDLAMFLSYDNKQEEKKKMDQPLINPEQPKEFIKPSIEINKEKIKVKKYSKKNDLKNIPGQLNFKDLGW